MAVSYWDKLKKLGEATEKYKHLDLENSIRMTLLECGFDVEMMNHVYINELVERPNVFGCYADNKKIVAYFINERGLKIVKEYENLSDFMLMFIRTAPNSGKYDERNEVLEIMTALSDYVDEKAFSVNELKLIPNHSGFFQRHGKWFVYITDEHAVCSINGPFDVHGVICAVLKKLHIKNTCYQWKTENERNIFLNNHFRSFAEVDEYMASYEEL